MIVIAQLELGQRTTRTRKPVVTQNRIMRGLYMITLTTTLTSIIAYGFSLCQDPVNAKSLKIPAMTASSAAIWAGLGRAPVFPTVIPSTPLALRDHLHRAADAHLPRKRSGAGGAGGFAKRQEKRMPCCGFQSEDSGTGRARVVEGRETRSLTLFGMTDCRPAEWTQLSFRRALGRRNLVLSQRRP